MSEQRESQQPAGAPANESRLSSLPEFAQEPEAFAVSKAPAPSAAPRQAARPAPASAAQPTSTGRLQRGSIPSVHYDLSYIVQWPERGPQGAIVLLHDFPGGAFTWADVLPRLESAGHAVYAFDMLCFGESSHPWPADTSVWGQADVLSYAIKALGLRDITLVGFGFGGGVAQVLATRLLRLTTKRLALLDSYGYDYINAPNWPLPDMAKRQDPEAPHHTPLDAVIADLRATLPQASANPQYLAGSKLDAYVAEWNTELGKELLFQQIRMLIPSYMNSVASDVRMLQIPTLLVWGAEDQITPVSLGERMRREIVGSQLQIVKGAGHLILDDAPDAVGSLLADFAR